MVDILNKLNGWLKQLITKGHQFAHTWGCVPISKC